MNTAIPIRIHEADAGGVPGRAEIEERDYPIVKARLEAGREGWRWIAVCPFRCRLGPTHVHGGGLLCEDPRRFLNHRAHIGEDAGYIIEDGYPEDSAKQIAEVHALIAKHRAGGACA